MKRANSMPRRPCCPRSQGGVSTVPTTTGHEMASDAVVTLARNKPRAPKLGRRSREMTTFKDDGGPLRFPDPEFVKHCQLVTQKLSGHTTCSDWLPEGTWDLLDELRTEHLRLRDQAVSCLEALAELTSRFEAEDQRRAEALREAARAANPIDAADERTSPEQRAGSVA